MGLSQGQASHLLNNKTRCFRYSEIELICESLEIHVLWLLALIIKNDQPELRKAVDDAPLFRELQDPTSSRDFLTPSESIAEVFGLKNE